MVEFKVVFSESGERHLACLAQQGKSIAENDACRSFDKFRSEVNKHRTVLAVPPGQPLQLVQLRLPGNCLGDRASRALVSGLIRGIVRVREVELSRNRFGDVAAQSFSMLIRWSPAPGLEVVDLSRNYLTQVGAGLLLDAAAKCGHYPLVESGAPLWLRVDRQRCPWPVLTGQGMHAQIEKANQLLDSLGKRLLSCQDAGPLSSCRLFCIPRPPESMRRLYEDGPTLMSKFCDSWPCHMGRCVHASAQGPVAHLPFFWAQDGDAKEVPIEASLHKEEPSWKTWAPVRPVSQQLARVQMDRAVPSASAAPTAAAALTSRSSSSSSSSSTSQEAVELPEAQAGPSAKKRHVISPE